MEVDVTKIPSLNTVGLIQTDASGNLSSYTLPDFGTNQSKILYLDANGYAGTPEKGDPFKPYQTHAAALAAASSGDVIQIVGAHTTTTNLAKDGASIIYYTPTQADGLEFTTDFAPMVFTGSDTTGTKVYLIGKGHFRATGSEGPPCVWMKGGANADTFVVDGVEFVSNAMMLLQGGTGGYINYRPKTHIHNGTSSAIFNSINYVGSEIYLGGFDLIITGQQVNNGVFSGVSGDSDCIYSVANVNIYSTVTQVDVTNFLLAPQVTATFHDFTYSNLHSFVNGLKMFDDLETVVGDWEANFGGDCSVKGLIGITTALDSELIFTGVGVLKASDRTIDVSKGYDLYINETTDFNTQTNTGGKIYNLTSATARTATIIAGSCNVGEIIYFRQDSTAGVTWAAGAGVTIINNSGILATTAIGDLIGLLRSPDSGNEVYNVIA